MANQKINREQIIIQALETLQKSKSFTQFSLRKVATDLNVDASTLYWHFKNKQEILQAMAAYVVGRVKIPDTNLKWDDQLKQLFGNMFDVYERYPFSAILMIETIPSDLVRLKLIDHTIGIMVDAGIDEQTANVAATSFDFLLTGLNIDLTVENRFRQQIVQNKNAEMADHVKMIHQNIKNYDLKHMQSSVKIRNQFSAKEQFEMGLDLIIDGLKKRLN
ncbi:TetR family transcriptional regulator [Pediococcus stilesii]|uniref:TetR family transcriptional regulator n=1 Tax=Pediococcus stilesii TaxID=331679 RepID=A0A5R9BSH5_9LACO|nr:TetR/AcrR family transcriptional regulator C-terminal domain-containing protein [Pediococcus stilesii]TLQ03666.1 TetR family transcriptional regulator [Pediococcus stilesii]